MGETSRPGRDRRSPDAAGNPVRIHLEEVITNPLISRDVVSLNLLFPLVVVVLC